jgi:hypothetical protein
VDRGFTAIKRLSVPVFDDPGLARFRMKFVKIEE